MYSGGAIDFAMTDKASRSIAMSNENVPSSRTSMANENGEPHHWSNQEAPGCTAAAATDGQRDMTATLELDNVVHGVLYRMFDKDSEHLQPPNLL